MDPESKKMCSTFLHHCGKLVMKIRSPNICGFWWVTGENTAILFWEMLPLPLWRAPSFTFCCVRNFDINASSSSPEHRRVFFHEHTELTIMAILASQAFLLSENKKKSSNKMFTPLSIELATAAIWMES